MSQYTILLTVTLAATTSGCGHHLYKAQSTDTVSGPPFSVEKINESTHLIIQNDKDFEFPYIYVKQYPEFPLSVVIDTGCGSQNSKATKGDTTIELKDFIEQNIPLEGDHHFMVVSSHCHFDHIGGMEAFYRSGASIVASGFNKSFVAPENLAANSLCDAFGTVTPKYTYDVFATQNERLRYQGVDLGLMTLHTPGHTPDSMAIYDEDERWIFTGDTLYKRLVRLPWGDIQDVPIVLPLQGNWKDFVASVTELLDFVNKHDQGAAPEKRIRLSAGHTTSGELAGQTIQGALDLIQRVQRDEVPIIAKVSGDEVTPGGTLGKRMTGRTLERSGTPLTFCT